MADQLSVSTVRAWAMDAQVAAGVERARERFTELRWHNALRRRTASAAAESRVRGAVASAGLEGAELAGTETTLPLVRDLMRGAASWSQAPDPVERITRAAVRVTAACEHLTPATLRAPAQVLSRLHLAAASGLIPAEQVGRPRRPDEPCRELSELGDALPASELAGWLREVSALMGAIGPRVPAGVVAAVMHAEVITVRPFVAGNGLVARALERVMLYTSGLDPTGVSVPEAGHRSGGSYLPALTGYQRGGVDGFGRWMGHWSTAMERAATAGEQVADAVLAGTLETPGGFTAAPEGSTKEG